MSSHVASRTDKPTTQSAINNATSASHELSNLLCHHNPVSSRLMMVGGSCAVTSLPYGQQKDKYIPVSYNI
eukprot:9771946-Heterocapsa_arctica.AAC.1